MRLALAIAIAVASPALAQDLAEGEAGFMAHCAVCHGTGAEGDGPMATMLTVAPADLTGLSEANGGRFPLARVIRRVDGTKEVLAHGGPMPVFGLILEGPSAGVVAPDGTDVVAPEAILNIAAWLETVQR